MKKDTLELDCKKMFGDEVGARLFKAMLRVAWKNFSVNVGWNDHQVSVSRSSSYRGRVFDFSDDYSHLVMPNGGLRSINSLTYADIRECVPGPPKINTGYCHAKPCKNVDPEFLSIMNGVFDRS
ncbi:MAG: hypothetical protein KJ592_01605 [Nanoarchaeota archaeon]|nr:hypothetical protein [Nanoarchaeota archaeon]